MKRYVYSSVFPDSISSALSDREKQMFESLPEKDKEVMEQIAPLTDYVAYPGNNRTRNYRPAEFELDLLSDEEYNSVKSTLEHLSTTTHFKAYDGDAYTVPGQEISYIYLYPGQGAGDYGKVKVAFHHSKIFDNI